jgi:opacity protein-like surface antigen
MKRNFLIIIFFVSIFIQQICAQINISTISFDCGLKRNYQLSALERIKHYHFYPEIQFGGDFFSNYTEWKLGLGFSNDTIDEQFPIKDYATYSYSSYDLGWNISVYPQKIAIGFPIPLYLLGGFSYHFISEKYIGGVDFNGFHRNDNSSRLSTIDVGFGLSYKIIEKLRVRLEGKFYFPLIKNSILESDGQTSTLKSGVDYILL